MEPRFSRPKTETFKFNPGGWTGGIKHRRDCGPRAVAIATDQPYQVVYDELQRRQEELRLKSNSKWAYEKKPHTNKVHLGTAMIVVKEYLQSLGWTWVATMGIGTGCKVHLKANELPKGRILCRVSRHFVAVVDGVINDTYNGSREGTRCVYGYFYKEGDE